MLELSRIDLRPGELLLKLEPRVSCWKIMEPGKELERAVARYIQRHALDMTWLRLCESQPMDYCLAVVFQGAEEEIWRLLGAAGAEWDAEPGRSPAGLLPLRRRTPLSKMQGKPDERSWYDLWDNTQLPPEWLSGFGRLQ